MTGGVLPPSRYPTYLRALALHEPRRLNAIIFDADLSLVTSKRFEILCRPANTEYTCRSQKIMSSRRRSF